MGVDRVDFNDVTFFRRDFAPATLGALMNALAVRDDAVLVSRKLMQDHRLEVGDQIEIAIPIGVSAQGQFYEWPAWWIIFRACIRTKVISLSATWTLSLTTLAACIPMTCG